MSASDSDYIDFDLDGPAERLCTVSGSQSGDGRFIQQRHGVDRYAHVNVVVSPHPALHAYRFTWRPKEGDLPLSFMKAACLEGMRHFVARPLQDGRHVSFIEVTVVGGSYHDDDTDEKAVTLAMMIALESAISKAILVDL